MHTDLSTARPETQYQQINFKINSQLLLGVNQIKHYNNYGQWWLVVKMARRAAKFNLWLNIYWIVALAVFIISGVSSHSCSPNLIKLVIFSCPY